MKPHSLRYEEIIRRSKDELKRKRNLDPVNEYDQGEGGNGQPMSYRERSKMIKDATNRDLLAKISMQDRSRSYSKNVKEIYMPRVPSKLLAQN